MSLRLEIENIAGIRFGEATLDPGVTSIRGSNWQGKSSFIKAIQTAMGTISPLTEGAQTGGIHVELDDRTVSISLTRSGTSVSRSGEPFLTDPYERRCAELFAFIGENNEVRNAVRSGKNLEAVLTGPLDLADIDRRIRQYQEESAVVERQLNEARQAKNRLTSLDRDLDALNKKLEKLRRERDLLLETANDADLSELHERLATLRGERSQVEDLIRRSEDSIDRTKKTLTERYESLEEVEVPTNGEISQRIVDEREELSTLEHEKELLETLYSANQRIIREGRLDLLANIDHRLLSDEVDCWICGQKTAASVIEEQLEAMRDRLDVLDGDIEDRFNRVSALEEQREGIRRARRDQQDLQGEIQHLEDTLTDRMESLESAEDRLAVLNERITDLEDEIGEADDQLTSIESEIKYREHQLEDLQGDIESTRNKAEFVGSLEVQLQNLHSEINRLRTTRSNIREEARRAFDTAVENVVSNFETGFESARLTGNFDLIVARDGREVDLNALSEGERELLGVVAALAGFEAYDVGDIVPIMALDGLGALANDNLERLTEFLEVRTDYLVVTVYPENDAIGDQEIDPGSWTIVSETSNPA